MADENGENPALETNNVFGESTFFNLCTLCHCAGQFSFVYTSCQNCPNVTR